MTEGFEDDFLHYILMNKCKKMIGGRRIYDWYGKKYPHVNAPLEYHGESWDFAFAEPGHFVDCLKSKMANSMALRPTVATRAPLAPSLHRRNN